MSRGAAIDRPQRLPIQVPLRTSESSDSFVGRLAIANHLRPSYLRTYLNDPPGAIGSIQPWRLAAVTGRTEEELLRVMPTLHQAARRQSSPRHRTPVPNPYALRRAAERDDEVKRLSRQFGLPRTTIIKALTDQITPTRFRHRQPHRSPILQDVAKYLDQLIADNPDATIWSIWKTLGQQRQTAACYGTVRNYVNRVLPGGGAWSVRARWAASLVTRYEPAARDDQRAQLGTRSKRGAHQRPTPLWIAGHDRLRD